MGEEEETEDLTIMQTIVPVLTTIIILPVGVCSSKIERRRELILTDRAMFSAIEVGMFSSAIKIINGSKDNRTSNGPLYKEMITRLITLTASNN